MRTLADGRIRVYNAAESPNLEAPDRLLPLRSGGALYTGLDLLAHSNFSLLQGRKFALLVNDTARNRRLEHMLDLLRRAGLQPELVLEPEHGLFGNLDVKGESGIRTDPKTGLRFLSLYSQEGFRPSAEQVRGIDLIVVDLLNLPVRCYTYITTLTLLMETARENNMELLILDRPNPYGLWEPQGSYLNKEYESFTSYAPVPFLYSQTLGEYALYMAATRFTDLKVSVVPVLNYERGDADAVLQQAWVNPSPNIPGLESALVYAGLVFFEGSNFSLGRGTTRPFVYSGAPWLRNRQALRLLRLKKLPGVQLGEVVFTPTSSEYRGKICRGLQFSPYSLDFNPLRLGYEYMRIVRSLHPDRFVFRRSKARPEKYFIDFIWGGPDYREAVENNLSWEKFRSGWRKEARDFARRIRPYRLY